MYLMGHRTLNRERLLIAYVYTGNIPIYNIRISHVLIKIHYTHSSSNEFEYTSITFEYI